MDSLLIVIERWMCTVSFFSLVAAVVLAVVYAVFHSRVALALLALHIGGFLMGSTIVLMRRWMWCDQDHPRMMRELIDTDVLVLHGGGLR